MPGQVNKQASSEPSCEPSYIRSRVKNRVGNRVGKRIKQTLGNLVVDLRQAFGYFFFLRFKAIMYLKVDHGQKCRTPNLTYIRFWASMY